MISGFNFGPGKISIAAGQSVTWTNGDDSPHQVALQSKPQRTALMLKGQTQSITFDEPGAFADACGLHPGMKGTIEVVARQ